MTGHSATFMRFALIGGGFSLLFSVVSSGLINFAGTPPFITTVIVFLLCIPAAFHAQKRFAFRVTATKKSAFLIYSATQVGSLAIVSAITTHFVTHMFWIDSVILLGTAGAAAVLSYIIGRFITFKPV